MIVQKVSLIIFSDKTRTKDKYKFVVNNAELPNVGCSHVAKMTKVVYLLSQCPATDSVYLNNRFHVSSDV